MRLRIANGIEWAFLAILAVRPSLDLLTNMHFLPGPLRLNAAALTGFFLLVAGFTWLVLLDRTERRQVLAYPVTKILIAWVLILLPWGLFSPELNGAPRVVAAREWVRLLTYIPLFALAFYLARRDGPKRLLVALFVSLMIPAFFGVYQILFRQGAVIQGAHRIQGTFDHPNPFSFYLVVLIGLTLWKLRWAGKYFAAHREVRPPNAAHREIRPPNAAHQEVRPPENLEIKVRPLEYRNLTVLIPWGLLLLLEMGLLGATFSFTGAGMFGVIVLVFALGENRRRRNIALALIVIFSLVFLATPTGRQRIAKVTQWDNLDEIERTGRETSSMVWRLLNWRFLVRTWKVQPWLGYGLNSSPTVNPNRRYNRTGPGQDPHNDYVRFLIDTGIVGELVWLGLLIAIGLSLRRAHRLAETPESRHFALTALALYAAWLAGSFNDNLIAATAYQYSLWTVFAIAMGWNSGTFSQSDEYQSN